MGRPITRRSAPALRASSGVAIRAWSSLVAPDGRIPGVIRRMPWPTSERTASQARALEIPLHRLLLEPAPQEIGPQELAERHRLLGVAAKAAQLAGEAAVGVVAQVGDRVRDVVERSPES